MPLSDLDCANLCQSQYNGEAIFDFANRIDDVSFAVKLYPDCTAIVFEGSHNAPDWFSNFDAVMVRPPGLGGVERGFYDGLPETLAALSPMLNGKLIYVTGHSRGAAHAHIFAAMLINAGYHVEVVVFGSPRPGDAKLAEILAQAPNRSYWNYRDEFHHDIVGDVPENIIWPYIEPALRIKIDVEPLPDDPWLLLARHHLSLYIHALQEIENGKSVTSK